MSVLELGSALVMPFDPRRRAPDRPPSREPPPRRAPESVAAPPPTVPSPPFLAPVFRPDLSQLASHPEPPPPAAPPGPDPEVYALLDRLVAAIRAGDLMGARAIVETLETQMLVERSAGRVSPPARPAELVRPAPPPLRAVDAVYETLAHYLVTDGLTS